MAENTSASLYFAYGSNLSPFQMKARCPDSEPLALAHLSHPWAWIINRRGFANVVDISQSTADVDASLEEFAQLDGSSCFTTNGTTTMTNGETSTTTVINTPTPATEANPGVYGVLYHLPLADEALLDVYEGVPFSYEKVVLPVTVVAIKSSKTVRDSESPVRQLEPSGKVEALVYVDYNNTRPDKPREEYIARMNRGIDEAMEQFGLPAQYVEQVMRPFIPKGNWDGAGISAGTGE